MKKRYEVIENGTLYPYNSFEKNSEGMAQAYEQVEQILNDRREALDQLEIQFVTYDEMNKIQSCELIESFVQ